MARLEYFFSVLSPFTYLAGDQLEQIAARHGSAIDYRPMDIMEVFGRTGGTPPKDRHVSRTAYRLQDLSRIAKLAGADINLTPAFWPTNPVPASGAIIDAQGRGGGDIGKLVRGILRACWAEDRNIAEAEVVADCLAGAGFPPGTGASGTDRLAQQFKANTDEAVARNVFGAPSYVVGEQVFWGQDRLGHLDAWLSGRLG